MPRVAWPIVRALVVARVGEIAGSPARQLASVVGMTLILLLGSGFDGVAATTLTWTKVLYLLLATQLGAALGAGASPTGGDLFDPLNPPGPGHAFAHLPVSPLERLAATSLLAVPMALPYLAGMLLVSLLPGNRELSVALHMVMVLLGFAAERAWKQVPGHRFRKWVMSQPWSLPVYGSPRGGEVRAAFWVVAARSAHSPVIVVAAIALVAWAVEIPHLGVVRGSLVSAGAAAACVGVGVMSGSQFLQPLSTVALSRRSLALATLLVVLALTLLTGAPAIALAAIHYRSAAGVGGAVQLLLALVGFEALAAVGMARVTPLGNPLVVTTMLFVPLSMALTLTGFIAALVPAAMHAIMALSVIAFASALGLALTTSRQPLPRTPAGVVGAARRLIGAA